MDSEDQNMSKWYGFLYEMETVNRVSAFQNHQNFSEERSNPMKNRSNKKRVSSLCEIEDSQTESSLESCLGIWEVIYLPIHLQHRRKSILIPLYGRHRRK